MFPPLAHVINMQALWHSPEQGDDVGSRKTMMNRKPQGEPALSNLASMVRVSATARPSTIDGQQQMRHMVADLCRLLGDRVINRESPPLSNDFATDLPPRMQETLDALLLGDSEKQIARKMQISQHTVHAYVKELYRRFEVCSRGELLSRFISK
jgi:DNA-binding NarL/FixJ family response regulator